MLTPDPVHDLVASHLGPGKHWTSCIFTDDDGTFLGLCVVGASGVVDAAITCHRLGINPGGQIVTEELPDYLLPSVKYRNRLLTREQVSEIWPEFYKESGL